MIIASYNKSIKFFQMNGYLFINKKKAHNEYIA